MKKLRSPSTHGKPKYAMYSVSLLHPGGVHGAYHVEDRMVPVCVPRWLDPSGWSYLPSSLSVHLLRMVQSTDTASKSRAMVVLDLLCRLFPKPVAWERWRRVGPKVNERAEQRQREEHEEIADAVAAALCLAEPTSSPDRSFEANLRQQLNERVTEDFLGTEWWRRSDPLSDGLTEPDGDLEDRLVKGIDRERFLVELRESLSEREGQLLTAIREGIKPREWGRAQGLADATVDVMKHRIREKGLRLARRSKLEGM